MRKGAVWLEQRGTQRLRRAKRMLNSGETLHLYYNPAIINQTVPEPLLVDDGGDYSVWNKPAGMRSQGSRWGDHTTLHRWAEHHLLPQRPAFTVHRLDRAAHGLMLLAHSKGAAAALSALFQQRQITKIYRATIHGLIDQTESPITIRTPIDGKDACSHVSLLRHLPDQNRSELEISIESGRKHQIRRHLAEIGHPIIGDRLYGSSDRDTDLMLCSHELAFTSPFDGLPRHFTVS